MDSYQDAKITFGRIDVGQIKPGWGKETIEIVYDPRVAEHVIQKMVEESGINLEYYSMYAPQDWYNSTAIIGTIKPEFKYDDDLKQIVAKEAEGT